MDAASGELGHDPETSANLAEVVLRDLLENDPARAVRPIEYVLELAEACRAEMRTLIFELRPESLEADGLVMSINRKIEALRARHGIAAPAVTSEEPEAPLADPRRATPEEHGHHAAPTQAGSTGGAGARLGDGREGDEEPAVGKALLGVPPLPPPPVRSAGRHRRSAGRCEQDGAMDLVGWCELSQQVVDLPGLRTEAAKGGREYRPHATSSSATRSP
jgi:hypothetical protein